MIDLATLTSRTIDTERRRRLYTFATPLRLQLKLPPPRPQVFAIVAAAGHEDDAKDGRRLLMLEVLYAADRSLPLEPAHPVGVWVQQTQILSEQIELMPREPPSSPPPSTQEEN